MRILTCNDLLPDKPSLIKELKFMKVSFKNKLSELSEHVVIIGLWQDETLEKSDLKNLEDDVIDSVIDVLKREEFTGKAGNSRSFAFADGSSVHNLVVVGLGKKADCKLETLRLIGVSATQTGRATKAKTVSVLLPILSKEFANGDSIQALIEGSLLSSYKFTRYLAKDETHKIQNLEIGLNGNLKAPVATKSAERALLVCEGVALARDLVNTPASDMTPEHLADQARKIKGVKTTIHTLADIKKMKMGSFLSVARGSTENPPYFIEMHYKPTGKAKKKIAIIGKGVTFDTGGYSLKPPKSMENMKDDKAGASAVISFMSIVSRLAPNVEISAYVAATENMVDGYAQKPGDICTAMNGKTIEVLNTDAEGRLTLADAMLYAQKNNPDYMIDMATLTGACIVALGMRCTGVMGNDETLIKKLIEAGSTEGEMIWELPLIEEYKSDLKSPIADLQNIGGTGTAGTISAGLFLQEFVEGNTKWAHLDIAGPSWTDKPLPYTPRGGTGVMVKTLARFMLSF